jgi:hypothetical protein
MTVPHHPCVSVSCCNSTLHDERDDHLRVVTAPGRRVEAVPGSAPRAPPETASILQRPLPTTPLTVTLFSANWIGERFARPWLDDHVFGALAQPRCNGNPAKLRYQGDDILFYGRSAGMGDQTHVLYAFQPSSGRNTKWDIAQKLDVESDIRKASDRFRTCRLPMHGPMQRRPVSLSFYSATVSTGIISLTRHALYPGELSACGPPR